MTKFLAIDEEGFFLLENGLRLNDEKLGHQMLSNIQVDEFGVSRLSFENETIIIEPFDKPYVARQIHLENKTLTAQMPYQLFKEVDLKSLCLDEWDRFHCKTTNGVPLVLSRAAQAELFNLADDFDDDSITILGETLATDPYYIPEDQVSNPNFWNERYFENPSPGWNLNQPHPELQSALTQLRINKQRILVPGCGYGHDAALLAKLGHIVTAVDISDPALDEAKRLYGNIKNLTFLKADVFDLGEGYREAFDMIFEHTCYSAVHPSRRKELVRCWRSYLDVGGHVLGIFFVVPKRTGPYFGGSEWEMGELLAKSFQFLYWTRLKHSPGWRKGAELLIYAQKQA